MYNSGHMRNKDTLLTYALESKERRVRAIYISTYIPRKCGIASYTKDLTNALNVLNPLSLGEIMAVTKDGYEGFPWEVKIKVKEQTLQTYIDAANYINESSADVVNLQHEFGIFGGADGEHILELTSRIKKPLVTTLHTVLNNPRPNQLRITKILAKQSEAVVVMVEAAQERLINIFGIDPRKIVVIPHGVPDIPYGGGLHFKEELGLGVRPIISAINLLSDNKGLEYVLRALPVVVAKHPDLLYLIIGQTHPDVIKNEGEVYRHKLEKIVKDLKLTNNVKFINQYVTIDDLIMYLRATDIYITPYLDPQQTSSGTLAYALGAGKVCISTPYLYAREILNSHRGLLVPFKDSEEIGENLNKLLSNPILMEKYQKSAYNFGRLMIWPQVALQYLDLFHLIQEKREAVVKVASRKSKQSVKDSAPLVSKFS